MYLEQEFKLTIDTNFDTLRNMCCDFWGLSKNQYSLYDEKFGHLMALNEDEHQKDIHFVSNYSHKLKKRYPQLYLLRDELEKRDVKSNVQLESATINSMRARSGIVEARVLSQDNRANKELEIKKKNFSIFNKAFPGQSKYQLDKEKRTKRVDIFLLPDTYFLTLIFNALLIFAVSMFFFTTRTVSEEYYMREKVIGVFEKESFVSLADDGTLETVLLQPFSKISSMDTFRLFMTETIPYTIFSKADFSQLQFSKQNPPLGPLNIRVQHWNKQNSCYQAIYSPEDSEYKEQCDLE